MRDFFCLWRTKMSVIDLVISNAYAEGVAPAAGGGIMDYLPLLGLGLVFYFMILRPQQTRMKEQKSMLEALQKNDEIVTTGGALGRVTKVGENYVGVEIADGITIQIQKSAVQTVLPKGTIKSAN